MSVTINKIDQKKINNFNFNSKILGRHQGISKLLVGKLKDKDGDKYPDIMDCSPNDPKKHGQFAGPASVTQPSSKSFQPLTSKQLRLLRPEQKQVYFKESTAYQAQVKAQEELQKKLQLQQESVSQQTQKADELLRKASQADRGKPFWGWGLDKETIRIVNEIRGAKDKEAVIRKYFPLADSSSVSQRVSYYKQLTEGSTPKESYGLETGEKVIIESKDKAGVVKSVETRTGIKGGYTQTAVDLQKIREQFPKGETPIFNKEGKLVSVKSEYFGRTLEQQQYFKLATQVSTIKPGSSAQMAALADTTYRALYEEGIIPSYQPQETKVTPTKQITISLPFQTRGTAVMTPTGEFVAPKATLEYKPEQMQSFWDFANVEIPFAKKAATYIENPRIRDLKTGRERRATEEEIKQINAGTFKPSQTEMVIKPGYGDYVIAGLIPRTTGEVALTVGTLSVFGKLFKYIPKITGTAMGVFGIKSISDYSKAVSAEEKSKAAAGTLGVLGFAVPLAEVSGRFVKVRKTGLTQKELLALKNPNRRLSIKVKGETESMVAMRDIEKIRQLQIKEKQVLATPVKKGEITVEAPKLKEIVSVAKSKNYIDTQIYNPLSKKTTGNIKIKIGTDKYEIKYSFKEGSTTRIERYYKNGKYVGTDKVSNISPYGLTEPTVVPLDTELKQQLPGKARAITEVQQRYSVSKLVPKGAAKRLTKDTFFVPVSKSKATAGISGFKVRGKIQTLTITSRTTRAGPAEITDYKAVIKPGEIKELIGTKKLKPVFTKKKVETYDVFNIKERKVMEDAIGISGIGKKTPEVNIRQVTGFELGGRISITPIKAAPSPVKRILGKTFDVLKKPFVSKRGQAQLFAQRETTEPTIQILTPEQQGALQKQIQLERLAQRKAERQLAKVYLPKVEVQELNVKYPGYFLSSVSKVKTVTIPSLANLSMLGVASATSIKQAQVPSDSLFTNITNLPKVSTSERVTQFTAPSMAPRMREVPLLETPFITPRSRITPPTTPPTQIVPRPPVPPLNFGFVEEQPQKAYDAYVKIGGTMEKINRVALTMKSALSAVAERVDTSIAGEGRIKPIKKPLPPSMIKDTGSRYYDTNEYKFRTYRVRKGKATSAQPITLIEKRRYRLDSPGEKGQIKTARNINKNRFRL